MCIAEQIAEVAMSSRYHCLLIRLRVLAWTVGVRDGFFLVLAMPLDQDRIFVALRPPEGYTNAMGAIAGQMGLCMGGAPNIMGLNTYAWLWQAVFYSASCSGLSEPRSMMVRSSLGTSSQFFT